MLEKKTKVEAHIIRKENVMEKKKKTRRRRRRMQFGKDEL